MFELSHAAIDHELCRSKLKNPAAGGFVSFEGWTRNHNDGREVNALEYSVYPILALKEGEKIIQEAFTKWPLEEAYAIHRSGLLQVGDLAVWVGASSAHRQDAFKACQYIIDEIKHRLPIWKKEYYADGSHHWVNCQACQKKVSQELSI